MAEAVCSPMTYFHSKLSETVEAFYWNKQIGQQLKGFSGKYLEQWMI